MPPHDFEATSQTTPPIKTPIKEIISLKNTKKSLSSRVQFRDFELNLCQGKAILVTHCDRKPWQGTFHLSQLWVYLNQATNNYSVLNIIQKYLDTFIVINWSCSC